MRKRFGGILGGKAMYNKEFYPTPQPVIDKMLGGLELTKINTVMEPSADDGRLVESLKELKENLDIDCVELDPDMRHILRGKGLRVVADDFLSLDTMKEYTEQIQRIPELSFISPQSVQLLYGAIVNL